MPASSPNDPYVQSGDQLEPFLRSFWQRQVTTAEEETPDFRHPPLPLARIKKVMKSDPDVRVSCRLCTVVNFIFFILRDWGVDDCCRW